MIYSRMNDPGHSPSIRFSGRSDVMRHAIRHISDAYRIASKRPTRGAERLRPQPTSSCRAIFIPDHARPKQHPWSSQNPHTNGLDERAALEQEAALWQRFVSTGLVDGGVGLTYIARLREVTSQDF